jgi:chemotaxis protein MotB
MAREKTPPKNTNGEIPAWFMTYSDVITLLMTFFILLLTFASQEPEEFERMKVSMFGAGGSEGIAGIKADSMDRESVISRYRPDMSRLTQHGTETPPTNVDNTRDGLAEGLKALEENSELAQAQRMTFSASRNAIIRPDGKLTPGAEKQLAAMSQQLIRFPMELSISVPGPEDLPAAVEMAYRMTYQHGVKLGRVAVATQLRPSTNVIQFTLSRRKDNDSP